MSFPRCLDATVQLSADLLPLYIGLPLAASANLLVRSQLKPIRLSTTQLFDSSNFVHITYSYTIQFQLQLPSTKAISCSSLAVVKHVAVFPNFSLSSTLNFFFPRMYFFAEYLVFSVHCKFSACRLAFHSSSLSFYISTALNFAVYIASFGIQGMLIFSIYSVPPLVYCNLFTLFLHMSSACVWFNELLANSFSITFSSFPLFLSLNSCLLLMRRTFV
jgi:hypothetical protein